MLQHQCYGVQDKVQLGTFCSSLVQGGDDVHVVEQKIILVGDVPMLHSSYLEVEDRFRSPAKMSFILVE
jgi:hypothetical protein